MSVLKNVNYSKTKTTLSNQNINQIFLKTCTRCIKYLWNIIYNIYNNNYIYVITIYINIKFYVDYQSLNNSWLLFFFINCGN